MVYTLTKEDKITLLKAVQLGKLDTTLLQSDPVEDLLGREKCHFELVDLDSDIEYLEKKLAYHKGQLSQSAFWDWSCNYFHLDREVIRGLEYK